MKFYEILYYLHPKRICHRSFHIHKDYSRTYLYNSNKNVMHTK